MYRGRFAPSPTGDLHLGSAAAALVAWLSARAAGGTLALRIEDIDGPRIVAGSEARQLDDLRWLGLDWDGAPLRQSERSPAYEAALATLDRQGLVYRCDCSRAEIARVASAPHAGDDGPRYPGTCRPHGMAERAWKRPPAIRLAVPPGEVVVDDALAGTLRQDVATTVGDFVLRRGDGVWAYQLAVVVDDLAMGITEVVRGVDLLASAPRQVQLAGLLGGLHGGTAPRFAHVPLVVAADGSRLAKRAPGVTLRDLRAGGATPADVLRILTRTLGLPDAASPATLVDGFHRRVLAGRTTAPLRA